MTSPEHRTARPPSPRGYTIGTLARLTGCPVETVRYYERIGILLPPPRTEGGHRAYDEDALNRVVFVRRSRALGFTLQEIRALLARVDDGAYTCAEVRAISVDHLRDIRGKITELRRMEHALETLVEACTGGDVARCRIIDALSGVSDTGFAQAHDQVKHGGHKLKGKHR